MIIVNIMSSNAQGPAATPMISRPKRDPLPDKQPARKRYSHSFSGFVQDVRLESGGQRRWTVSTDDNLAMEDPNQLYIPRMHAFF